MQNAIDEDEDYPYDYDVDVMVIQHQPGIGVENGIKKVMKTLMNNLIMPVIIVRSKRSKLYQKIKKTLPPGIVVDALVVTIKHYETFEA